MSNETDLDWLARNVHEWPTETDFVFVGTGISHGNMGWYPADYCFSKSSLVTKQQWLTRRAELQNKPGWWDLPDWAIWISQDSDGSWWMYETEPKSILDMRGTSHWSCSDGCCESLLLFSGEVTGDYMDTLEKRPEEFKLFTSIEDNQEQEMKQDNGWFERGELPTVGCLCLYVVSDRLSAEVEITAHAKFGLCFVMVGTSGESYVSKTAELHRFRPIRTEREVLIEIIASNLSGTTGKVADAIIAAGFKLGGK